MGTPSVNTDLALHLKLDGDANDASGFGRHGTAFGGFSYATDAPSALSGEISRCADLDGVNDYILATLDIDGETDVAVSMWFKTASNLTNKYLFSMPESSSGSNGFDLRGTSTAHMANYLNASTTDREKSIFVTYSNSAWHHIGWAYSTSGGVNDKFRSFYDGSKQPAVADPSGVIEAASTEVNIGRFGTFGAYAPIKVCDVRVYVGSVPSDSEFGDIYAGDYTGGGGSGGAAVQYYRRRNRR